MLENKQIILNKKSFQSENDIQKKMGTVVEFELLPKIVLSVFSRGTRGDTNATNDELKVDLSKIDTKLLTSLLPFQKDGVELVVLIPINYRINIINAINKDLKFVNIISIILW